MGVLRDTRQAPPAEDGGVCFLPQGLWGAMKGSLSRGLAVNRVF